MLLAAYDDGRLGVVAGDEIVDVSETVREAAAPSGRGLMHDAIGGWAEVAPALRRGRAGSAPRDLASVRLRAPVPYPSKVVAAPVNYLDHMTEMNVDAHVGALGVFLLAPSSLLDPEGAIQLPYLDRRFDQEGELAVIVGRRARHVGEDAALEHVFGYTALLDITMRGGEDRSTRKSFDTFTPLGPWVATSDEFGPPHDVELRCSVNGESRQQASTRDLIWNVPKLMSYVSSVMTLEPGDIIATGTPAGVGPIGPGDTVEVELSGIGTLRTSVAADHAVPCPTRGADRGPVPPPPQSAHPPQ